VNGEEHPHFGTTHPQRVRRLAGSTSYANKDLKLGQPLVPNTLHDAKFMLKDSQRLSDGRRWGYAAFEYDVAPSSAVTHSTALRVCWYPDLQACRCALSCLRMPRSYPFVLYAFALPGLVPSSRSDSAWYSAAGSISAANAGASDDPPDTPLLLLKVLIEAPKRIVVNLTFAQRWRQQRG
jgi:hypothetical protein